MTDRCGYCGAKLMSPCKKDTNGEWVPDFEAYEVFKEKCTPSSHSLQVKKYTTFTCVYCNQTFESREVVIAHAQTCEDSPHVKRYAELESVIKDLQGRAPKESKS